jgi:hypothetical protein
MKYDKKILIAGAVALNAEAVEKIRAELVGQYEAELKILERYAEDQPKIEAVAREIVRKAEDGEEITDDFLKKAFEVPNGRGSRSLGLDSSDYKRVQANIVRLEEQFNVAENHSSPLVEFLNIVEDDFVSDYGLKMAGFTDIKTSQLVRKGVEALRAAAKTA